MRMQRKPTLKLVEFYPRKCIYPVKSAKIPVLSQSPVMYPKKNMPFLMVFFTLFNALSAASIFLYMFFVASFPKKLPAGCL